jgi:hypothetical protein
MAKLENTILIDKVKYEVNAVEAEYVKNALTIKSIGLTGEEKSTEHIDFNGSNKEEISIVSANGGRFNGPVRVKRNDISEKTGEFNDEAVLNYEDIKEVVLHKLINTSVLYKWACDADEKLVPAVSDGIINGISVVVGTKEALKGNDGFYMYNYNKWQNYHNHDKPTDKANYLYLASYLYVCVDSGDIYFCTADSYIIADANSAKPVQLATDAHSITTVYGNGNETTYTAETIRNIELRANANKENIENISNGSVQVPEARNAYSAELATKAQEADEAEYADYARNLRYKVDRDDGVNETVTRSSENLINTLDSAIADITDIKNGKTAVGKALLVKANYRAKNQTTTTDIYPSITISRDSPPTTNTGIYTEGDIWIKY